jgi:hypothetical protein
MSKDDQRLCPECGLELHIRAKSCRCGWSSRALGKPKDDPFRYDCAWEADGKRCRYPGNISSNINGAGPWYCRWHDGCDDPVHGARLVEESQNYQPEDTTKTFQAEVNASLLRLGLQRREGESVADHASRCRAWVLEELKRGIGKPLPYDPTQPLEPQNS